ncbi:unnamed protein product [Mytilus coruscus]|uniref:Uncharacterized protein n=1 Tax=Mytilus coruscus TaxID=42192 RepID=A0A6J8DYU5_MYTCO|nr:unnamed protein product [Mytilus coruscus]
MCFTLKLTLSHCHIIVEPSKSDVLISWNLASRRLLRLYFARIFPIPDCQIFHNGTSILQTPTTISERDGNFYNVSVSFVSTDQLELCDGYLDIQCSLNNQTISVGNKRALPVCYDLRKEKSNHKILLVVLGILALVLLQCVLSRLITNPKQVAWVMLTYNRTFIRREDVFLLMLQESLILPSNQCIPGMWSTEQSVIITEHSNYYEQMTLVVKQIMESGPDAPKPSLPKRQDDH